MAETPEKSFFGDFEATTLGYLITPIFDQIYYIGSVHSIEYIEFEIYPQDYVELETYSAWLTEDPGKLITPLEFDILEPLRDDYFGFDPST
jgi:hypothetical protein